MAITRSARRESATSAAAASRKTTSKPLDEIASKIYQGQIAREKDSWYQQARRAAAVEIKLQAK